MSKPRQFDNQNTEPPPRSDRIFNQQDLWYFKTREDEAVGPFRYRSEAESNLDRFMQHLRNKLGQAD